MTQEYLHWILNLAMVCLSINKPSPLRHSSQLVRLLNPPFVGWSSMFSFLLTSRLITCHFPPQILLSSRSNCVEFLAYTILPLTTIVFKMLFPLPRIAFPFQFWLSVAMNNYTKTQRHTTTANIFTYNLGGQEFGQGLAGWFFFSMWHSLWSLTRSHSAGVLAGLGGQRRLDSHVWSPITPLHDLALSTWPAWTFSQQDQYQERQTSYIVPQRCVSKVESKSCISLKPALEVIQCHFYYILSANTSHMTSTVSWEGETDSTLKCSKQQRVCSHL